MDYETAKLKAAECFCDRYDSDKPLDLDGLGDESVRCERRGDAYVLIAESMYEAPVVRSKTTLDAVLAVSEMFGTDKVDIEMGARDSGCESCDYGSCYGTEIVLTNPTKNVDVLEALLAGAQA